MVSLYSIIKMVSLYSTIKMMHGPINIRFSAVVDLLKRLALGIVAVLSMSRCMVCLNGTEK